MLTVADVRRAAGWYGEVFGMVEHVRIGDGHRPQLELDGERQGSMVDPFGRRWVVTQTVRDVDPTEWGGATVVPRR